jgi:hypothetical protein
VVSFSHGFAARLIRSLCFCLDALKQIISVGDAA